ncbi:hypothetical protein EV182_005213, partial [Spiromyces aspiralis]
MDKNLAGFWDEPGSEIKKLKAPIHKISINRALFIDDNGSTVLTTDLTKVQELATAQFECQFAECKPDI